METKVRIVIGLILLLTLAACESEDSCYNKIKSNLSDNAILAGDSLLLLDIKYNEDLDACDYTTLGGRLTKI